MSRHRSQLRQAEPRFLREAGVSVCSGVPNALIPHLRKRDPALGPDRLPARFIEADVGSRLKRRGRTALDRPFRLEIEAGNRLCWNLK